MIRRAAVAVGLGVLGSLVGIARPAKADDSSIFEGHHENALSPQNFALEVRAAIYKPQVDSDPQLNTSGGQGPFAKTFGNPNPQFEVGIEFDWQAYRIPHVGSIGPGISVGYYNVSALADLTGTNTQSGETTTLEILPMYAVGVFRLDVLWREAHIPLVPYAKAGIGYALWRASNTVGTSQSPPPGSVVGEGHTWGTQFAGGIAFNIGILDPNSVHQLDEATGINNTYLFAEYMAATLDGIGQKDPLRVGSDSFVFGLSFEF